MATSGTFTVLNKSGATITGHVSHKNNADEAICLTDLHDGQTSSIGNWHSGAGTHDSWYWSLSFGGGAAKVGSHGCALYAKDENANTVITIKKDEIVITPPVSGECSSSL